MHYRATRSHSTQIKKTYADTLEQMLQKKEAAAQKVRIAYAKDIFTDPERYRNEFRQMLGWPLTEPRPQRPPAVKSELLAEEEDYSIIRMQFEAIEGVWCYGLLFQQHGQEPRPLVIAQHGKDGSPELISGMDSDSSNYNDMVQRLLKQGVHVFAPQFLLWNEVYEAPYDRDAADARLKRLGGSMSALELYELSRILDYFDIQPYVTNFGMVGLSYGGYFTLFAAALDTRIRSAVSCSFFNTRDQYVFPDWTWFGAAHTFDDTEIACLVYPRRLCLEMGNQDNIFDHRRSTRSYEIIKELAKEHGTDWVDLIIFEGLHEFHWDDAPLIRLVNDLK